MSTANTPTPPPSNAAQEEAKERRKLWDIILTTTPVVLTVLATMMAGRSSTEMTLAQYYRAVAAQNQSKVGDQWAFFQAKKIRGTSMEMTIGLLQSLTENGEVDPERLLEVSDRLVQGLEKLEAEAGHLQTAVQAAGNELNSAQEPLSKAATSFKEKISKRVAEAKKLQAQMYEALTGNKEKADGKTAILPEVTAAFEYIKNRSVPIPKEEGNQNPLAVVPILILAEYQKRAGNPELDPPAADVVKKALKALDPPSPGAPKPPISEAIEILKQIKDEQIRGAAALPVALKVIEDRRPDQEVVEILKLIKDDLLHGAIEIAWDRANIFDKAGRGPSGILRKLDGILNKQVTLAQNTFKDVRPLTVALADIPAGNGAKLNDVRTRGNAVTNLASALKTMTGEAGTDFKEALLGFDSRRYDREARYNQVIAGLYEIQVRKSDIASDRHRERSVWFFYAMLAAQAGVTVGTFSLAVRHKSTLWAIASLAGLAAIGIFGYVSLYFVVH
jgi:hypothetical protein